jgi:hypothetical protein
MKKTFLLFFSFAIMSCSDSDSSGSSSNSYINPPTWIKGTWVQEGSTLGNGYIFTSNDFLLKNTIGGNTSFKQAIETTISTGGNADATEEITSSIYNISITIGAQTYDYDFQKISDTKIEWMNDPIGDLGNTYYVKQ